MKNGFEDNEEYLTLKKFVLEYSEHFTDASLIPEEQRPKALIEKMEKMVLNSEVSFSLLKKSMNVTVSDYIERSENLHTAEEINKIDQHMRRTNTITLTELMRLKSRSLKKLIKKGRIDGEEEALLVKSVLDAPDYMISKKDRNKLEDMMIAADKEIVEKLNRR